MASARCGAMFVLGAVTRRGLAEIRGEQVARLAI
jgi:hypothetical protein